MRDARALDDSRRAEFERRTLDRNVPENLRRLSEPYIRELLIDPESARFRFDFASREGNVTGVCGAVNSRNRMGGYAGFTRFFVEFRDGRPIDGALLQNTATRTRMVQNCGFTDVNDMSRSTANP
ncbi:hypothetical protein [Roseomonas rosulenta]|uniref:hypothetical protein n=1 Tax=Roseomonas rosulenta TaxID=2748667 RepID=UPI001E60B953|nr:hypothetical protein [Roseomonas rosulenta]